ncbi:MAG TPA: aminotransferase class III-fold pyridoxal phosphate-dependent enzyme, partial [Rhizomicrobium sp.]
GLTPMHPQFDLPLPGFEKVPTPYWYGSKAMYGDITPEELGHKVAEQLEKKILELGADNVASFSAEPVHGAGGVIFPPPGYWDEINRICKKHDVLLHTDEVITGFGRTGEWFGSITYGIKPDIMTMAKGLSSGYQPISAISLGERMGDAIVHANEELVHGYTYSGHPVASAVALKNLEVMEREKMVPRVKNDIGPYMQRRLRETFEGHPIVGEVRGIGLIAAIELVADKGKREFFPNIGDVGGHCRNYCFNSGLVSRAIRDTMVLAPPFIISESEVEEIIAKLKAAIDNTARDYKKM